MLNLVTKTTSIKTKTIHIIKMYGPVFDIVEITKDKQHG